MGRFDETREFQYMLLGVFLIFVTGIYDDLIQISCLKFLSVLYL